jgi:magnesium-protoporphyrin O-methyltransferase
MSCCCPHSRSAGRFFSLFARCYRRRFERRGFEPSQRQLMAGIGQAGYLGASVLEIGSGVGHLHQSLLEQGAATAVGIDLAPDMIAQAQRWAAERGLAGRTTYLEGDFMELADRLEPSDLTLMDKVLCCYPDAPGLVHRSLDKTRRVYGLTYPRDRWFIRWSVRLMGWLFWLIGSDFRTYVHDPDQVECWIVNAGFEKRFERRTPIWLTQVYVCPDAVVAGAL